MMKDIDKKIDAIRRRFREIESAVIAFSGGADSSVLTKIAHEELKSSMLAVTAQSSVYTDSEIQRAVDFCKQYDIPHEITSTDGHNDPNFRLNPKDRCYYCKKNLYNKLTTIADEKGFTFVVEGTNASEIEGHRPGYKASLENNRVVMPLLEAKITKNEVREIAKILGLIYVAKLRPQACLASRIPFGEPISDEKLRQIECAEMSLSHLNIRQFRVRHHGSMARIEVGEDDLSVIVENKEQIILNLQKIGYKYITLDLMGYRPHVPDEK